MQISLCCYIVILMENNSIFIGLLQLLAGIGIFLTGCDIMSSNLEAASSDRMKQLLAKVSNNKIVGVLIGAAATIVIQSSSATTVMAIGFVNAKIISLLQAATIIFGAEIGTTLTGQLVALGMFGDSEISLSVLFSALAGLGVFVTMFSRKEKVRIIGKARGRSRGYRLFSELVEKAGGIDFSLPVCMAYAGLSDDNMRDYMKKEAALFEGKEDSVHIIQFGATVGTYSGPGAFAIGFFHKRIASFS